MSECNQNVTRQSNSGACALTALMSSVITGDLLLCESLLAFKDILWQQINITPNKGRNNKDNLYEFISKFLVWETLQKMFLPKNILVFIKFRPASHKQWCHLKHSTISFIASSIPQSYNTPQQSEEWQALEKAITVWQSRWEIYQLKGGQAQLWGCHWIQSTQLSVSY